MEASFGMSPRVEPKGYRDMRERGIPMRQNPSATGWQDPVYPAYKCKASVTLAKIALRWVREEMYEWLATKSRETARVYRRVITDYIKECTYLFSETTYDDVVAWAMKRGGDALAYRDLMILSSFVSHLQRKGYRRFENHARRAKKLFKP